MLVSFCHNHRESVCSLWSVNAHKYACFQLSHSEISLKRPVLNSDLESRSVSALTVLLRIVALSEHYYPLTEDYAPSALRELV